MKIINRIEQPPKAPPLRKVRSVEFGSLMSASIAVFFIVILIICLS